MQQTRLSMKETSFDILKQKASKIQWFFTDVDGTLTDGGVYYSPDGELLKRFSLRDGTGFFLLREAGIKTGIITGENSPIVSQRAKKLKVDEYLYGSHKKVQVMQRFLDENGLSFENVAYIGDELNDVKLLRESGLSFAVGDADKRAKDAADVICVHDGGRGAFRESAEVLLNLKGIELEYIIESEL